MSQNARSHPLPSPLLQRDAIQSSTRMLTSIQVRDLVEDVDVNGMTFLMHATSSATVPPTDAQRTAAFMRQRRAIAAQKTSTQATAGPSAPNYARARGSPAIGRVHGIAEGEEEDKETDLEAGGPVSRAGWVQARIGDNPSASDGARGGFGGGVDSRTSDKTPRNSMMVHGDETRGDIADVTEGIKETTNPSLVVFKTCWAMVEEVLWKGQV